MKKIKNNIPYIIITFMGILLIDNFIDICCHHPIEWVVNLSLATIIPLAVVLLSKE